MLAAALATAVLAAAVPQARADDTAPAPAPAAAPATAPAHWYDSITLSGSVDLYYDYNTNSPADRTNQLQNWTTRNNQFALPLAELSLTQASTVASPVGFKFTLGYGDAMDLIDYQPNNSAYKNIKEAYVTYLVDGKSATPTTLTLGKFVTPNGAEVIESQHQPAIDVYCHPYRVSGQRVGYRSRQQQRQDSGLFCCLGCNTQAIDHSERHVRP
jgi:hypothetical protein